MQNASGGTDHGTAAPMFMIAKNIKQGVVGTHPSLTDLDQGDLKYNLDFRSVYATVLQNWLETPSKPILESAIPDVECAESLRTSRRNVRKSFLVERHR